MSFEGKVARGDRGRVVIWGQLAPSTGAFQPVGKMRADIHVGGDLVGEAEEYVGGTLVAMKRFTIGPPRR